MNLDELVIARFCIIDELLSRVSGGWLRQHRQERTLPDSEMIIVEVIGMYLELISIVSS